MKRISSFVAVLVLIFLLPVFASAQAEARRTYTSVGGDLVTLELTPMTAAGDYGWVEVGSFGFTSHMLSFTYTTQPSAVTVKLQCSNDAGATSSDIGSSTSTTGATIQGAATCGWVNVNISGLTGSIRMRPVYRGFGASSSALTGAVAISQTTPGTTNGVAIEQIGTTTVVAGNGVTGAGSQRVTIASDNTPFPVKVDQTTPGTTNAVSLAQIGATTVTTGNGVASAGAQRVAVASDNTAFGVKVTDSAGTNQLGVDANHVPFMTQGLAPGDTYSNASGFQMLLNYGGGYGPLLTGNLIYDGSTNWQRPRSATAGNNIAAAGIAAASLYAQYNTPQSNSTAPLGNITTAQYADLQTDISGRLITTPGVTQMAWQTAQVSGVTATTTTRNTFTGLGQFNSCYVLLRTTTTGTATGTLNIYVQDSVDGGTTWDDLISSVAIAFGAATATQRFTLSGQVVGATITTAASTGITQGSAVVVETLAAGSARQGPWGDQIRIREKVSGPSGSPVGVTYKIDAVCKN